MLQNTSWLNFYSLFVDADNYSGPGAEAKFIFTQPDCSGNYTITFNHFNDKLCNDNVISNAPKITATHLVEFSAHTIKTSQNGIYIKWKKAYTATGYGSYVSIDVPGTVDYPSYLFSTGIKGDNLIAVRIENNRYVLVENTLSTEISPGTYTAKVVSTEPLISNSLQQNVCIAGSVNSDCKWSKPVVVELNTL